MCYQVFRRGVQNLGRFPAKHQHSQRKITILCQQTVLSCQKVKESEIDVNYLCRKRSEYFLSNIVLGARSI